MQLGRYHILKQLATGSIADVLLARASGLEGFARHVVIKRIRPELAREERFVRAFLDEARISASLHHQNIVQVHDIGEQDGAYYFAMEYVHGEDVRRLIHRVRERGVQVPLEHAITIVSAAATGLHHAHEKVNPSTGERLGIVHRDVSPANILIGYDGSVKITDFGLARAAQRSTTTATGSLKGKASYMSPEQCTGRGVDRRSDTFSLGVVLFELLTAQRLFKGANDFMTMAAVVEGDVPRPSTLRAEIPPALDEILLRCLARVPGARYQTAESLRESLEAFAMAQEMRTSAKAIADYMIESFGDRPEPWTPEAQALPAFDIDVESTYAGGLVSAPRTDKRELLARHAPKVESPMALAQLAVEAEEAAAAEDEEFGLEEVATTVGSLDPEPTAQVARSMVASGRPLDRAAVERDQQTTLDARPLPDAVVDGSTVVEPPKFAGRPVEDDDARFDDEEEPETEIQRTEPLPLVRFEAIPPMRPVQRGSVPRMEAPATFAVDTQPTTPLAPSMFGPDTALTTDPLAIPRAPTDAVYTGPPAPPLTLAGRLDALSRPQRVVIVVGASLLVLSLGAALLGTCGEDAPRKPAAAPVEDAAPPPVDADVIDAPMPAPKKKPGKRASSGADTRGGR